MKNDEYYIKRTINEAKKCEKTEDIPVGCIIVDKNTGRIVGKAHNKRNKDQIVTKHAEILAIEKVNKKIKSWHLNNYKLYTSLEPCEMCKKVIEMPGSGKSTIGFLLAQKTGREFVDIDTEIYKASGKTPEEIIKLDGEPEFRDIESKLLEQACTGSGKVISCGGGAILRESNINAMKKNSSVVWLMRDLNLLETCGRPLSEKKGVKELFKTREGLYAKAADIRVENNGTLESTVNIILKEIKNEDNCG